MDYEQMNNNKVYLRGKIVSEPVFSHEVFDEKFYEFLLEVPRLSESFDTIPVTISERLIDNRIKLNDTITITGQFRSYNKQTDGRSKLVLTVFVREIEENNLSENPNTIELNGFICKEPVFRTTPFKREISDVLLAVNRAYNKSDYIPCIAWGRNARFVRDMKVGEALSIVGRIQSRLYQKKISDDVVETKNAYEISIIKLITNDVITNNINNYSAQNYSSAE
ncbi:MAG TPA: single-stranded DNA-binding protein [Clostridiales bacterium]|nr:single-stranded DNA-binding protein [Clostridiales bacterium]